MYARTLIPVNTDIWSTYVRRLLRDSYQSEAAFVKELSVPQGTFNRWKNGLYTPTKAADVAQFATECGRNVLEAFVAAGMLTLDEAGKGLPAKSRQFLADLGGDEGGSVASLPRRGGPPSAPLSEAPSTVSDAIAAHDEDVSIAGEQEESDTP